MFGDRFVDKKIVSVILEEIENIEDDDYLLLFASEGCKACHKMKDAFSILYDAGQVPCNTYCIDLREGVEMGRAFTGFGLSNLPTLIHARQDEERKRWGGFFDGDLRESAERLRVVLDSALQATRDPCGG